MYQLDGFLSFMPKEEIEQMEDILKCFYNLALRSNKEFTFFTSGFKMHQKSNMSKKEQFESYAVFIEEYIKTFSEKFYTPGMIKSTSKYLVACIMNDPDFLQTFKQSGSENLIYYVKLTIFEAINRDYTMGLLIKYEKHETIIKINRSKTIELI